MICSSNSHDEQCVPMKNIFYTLYCFLILYPASMLAQHLPGQLLINYNSENGLPQNSAKSASLDKDGFLWVGTEMGLARFDGNRFKTFNHNNTPQLAYDRIVRVGLMNDHTMYFRDEKNGLYRFDTGQQMQKMGSDSELLTHSSMPGFFDLQRAWTDNKKLENIMKPHLPGHTLFLNSSESNTGFLFFGNVRYFAYLSEYKMQWADTLVNQKGTAAYQGNLYYLDSAGNIFQIDSLRRRSKLMIRNIPQGKEAPRIRRLGQDAISMYCQVGTVIWQLRKINDQTLEGKPVMDITDVPNWDWYFNAEKLRLHFTGSPTKGLFIAKQNPFRVLRPPAGISPVMYSQTPLEGGLVLTSAGVLPTGTFSLPRSSGELIRLCTFRDNQQRIWVVNPDTLCVLDQQLNLARKFYLDGAVTQCIQQTSDGTIWIAANNYLRHESRFGQIKGDSVEWKHTNGNKCYNETFIPLNNHLFWLGNKNGLQELNLEKGTVRDFPIFANADVRSLYNDRKGIIWIGTYGNGFYAWYQDRFVKLPFDRNRYLNTAHTFMEDHKGFLWITTNRGLFQAQMNDLYAYLRDSSVSLYYHYYDKLDGLPTNEFNGGCNPAGVVLQDGTFSLPSMDGLVQFHPDSIVPQLSGNRIFIDEVWVDSTRLAALSDFNLPASFDRISISVSSPYFGNPYNQYIEYNLKGLDDKWYPLNEDNTIIFNRLNHGKYQLQLRKKAGFGVNNYVYTRINISVQPGFFDTWAFRISLLVLAGLLILGLMKFRYRYLVRNKNVLEREVAARTVQQKQLIGELQSTVKELEQSREELFYNNRFKEKMALLITHDLQSPLRFLSVMCDQLNESAAGQAYREVANTSKEIKNASQEIHAFVEEFGLWATTHQENFQINITRFSLQSLMEELGRFFKEMMQTQGNIMIMEIDASVRMVTDRQLLKIILRNLIDNANKHTKNGSIRIVLETKGDRASIAVHDNGNGMQPKELQKIHSRMAQHAKAAIIDKDSRLGYQLIIDFIGALRAKLSVESTPGKGTNVVIGNLKCLQAEVESR